MKCFVTGATGFLGNHVARELLAHGAELRLFVRSTSRTENIADLTAEQVLGDLRDLNSLKRGMAGCEVVFHVAADYRLWALNGKELYDSNVEGTRNILRAAGESGIRRVVYTSSVATMGFGNNGTVTDESTPVALPDMIGDYKRSKFLAEHSSAVRSGLRCRCRRYTGYRHDSQARTARDAGCGEDGPQEDVRHQCQGRA